MLYHEHEKLSRPIRGVLGYLHAGPKRTRSDARGDGRYGVCWRPVWAILEGQFELMLVNPHHVKAIPGRKTDAKD
jgi:hypothetical protein